MEPESNDAGEFAYPDTEASHTAGYLWPTVSRILADHFSDPAHGAEAGRIFDLGCGNGAFARKLLQQNFTVCGVDPSQSGIEQAHRACPEADLHVGGCYEDLAGTFGTFPAVVSLEVVEHVYSPRLYAKCVYELLEPGGIAIVSTPYHSYLKNLALALSGKMESHFGPLWDHGHIKFWSVASLTELFAEQGMPCERVDRVGRIPVLAKSMILTFRRPSQG